ncbi:uncharacterized protein LOC143536202 [Bidens hawaiensis]|uniref:uncharacterized protein LOC143536202 n=1 Tax=Bidens hawaiensis TaxID=980011 RepID=UPI00404A3BF3
MVVLQHDHSLSLIDLNPKYPYDETIYDDEEDLIVKQAFQSSCDRCHQEITYYHKCYYKCDQCDYSLHKLCGEVPIELQHASHSAHTLTLFLEKPQGHCQICRSAARTSKNNQDDPSVFHLPFPDQTQNKFTELFSRESNAESITHKSHEHPLILVDTMISKAKDLCNGCLRPIMDIHFYKCNTYGCDFVLHELCTRLPSTLDKTCPAKHGLHLNQESIHSTCARLKALPKLLKLYGLSEKTISKKNTHKNKFHRHPLSFEKETRSDRGCSRCHLSLTGDFIFKCLQCEYVMHAFHLYEEDDMKYKVIKWNEYPYHRNEYPYREIHLVPSLKRTRKDGRCPVCIHDIKGGDYIFQCGTCDYAIHAYHVHNPRRPLL